MKTEETNIHSHGVHGTGLVRLAVLFQLGVAALVVATFLRESRAHGVHGIVLAAVRKRLVVAAALAREVQSVAETFRAQPEQRPLVRGAVHRVEQRQQHQADQDYRPGSAPSEHCRFPVAAASRHSPRRFASCLARHWQSIDRTYTARHRGSSSSSSSSSVSFRFFRINSRNNSGSSCS